MNLRFGLLWAFRNPDYARVPWEQLYQSHLDLISDSEAMGYDNAWLTEHHFTDDGYSPSLLPIAAAIAARTRRIRIGTFLVLLPLHNPVRVAEDSATVDLISHGRFDLGIGLGYRVGEFDEQGIPHAERAARLREHSEIVQRLLSGETLTYDGKFSQLKGIRIVPPALQTPHPPMWLGAIAPKAIERAAKRGFHLHAVGSPESVEVYDSALKANGRDPHDYNVAQLRFVHVAQSRDQAWDNAGRAAHETESCYARWFAEAADKPEDAARAASTPSLDEVMAQQQINIFSESAMIGSPEDVKGMLDDYVKRGRVTHLVMGMAMPGLAPHLIRDSMEMFARDVMPAFKR